MQEVSGWILMTEQLQQQSYHIYMIVWSLHDSDICQIQMQITKRGERGLKKQCQVQTTEGLRIYLEEHDTIF